CQHYYSTPLTV
nr:immunoglobulin light chain junction region [Macaca mulatta]MPN81813.1 immunoglobulin light chain junction region [Macaca mulatta]MPN82173.1 immunoglobulin light chain junction region [Macaca mulatta]MPN82499.1 immunoglobulin light chain junction region [Macaca mulatta]MPN82550.1 immunoglobulin light chain junction region [Macaca mulatta]